MSREKSGLSDLSAAMYGCEVKNGKHQYFQCLFCKTILAPFEVRSRGLA